MLQGPSSGPPPDDPTARWAEARELWHVQRDPAAFGAWRQIDPESPEGREVQVLLGRSEIQYELGIAQLQDADPAARATLERAMRTGPMAPSLYLPLARAFRDRGRRDPQNVFLFIRAAEFYRKFLLWAPDDPRFDAARRELSEIDPEGSRLFQRPAGAAGRPQTRVSPAPPASSSNIALSLAGAASLLALGGWLGFLLRSGARSRGVSLAQLAKRRPELQPAIAYLVASLRHELLKHRIGAIAGPLRALGKGDATETEHRFLVERLYGGQPLLEAWEGHMEALRRALGSQLRLMADPELKRADRGIKRIVRLRGSVERGAPAAIAALGKVHESLVELDAHLASLRHSLVQTTVDGILLREVFDQIRGEYAPGQISLDEVEIRAPEPPPQIEVFRVDLVLILKNVLRNAILAVGRASPPRRVSLEVRIELELSGEESVVVRIRDSSPEPLTSEDIRNRRADRGLGLVTAALHRYRGSISVENPGDPGGSWGKAVVIRFFRGES